MVRRKNAFCYLMVAPMLALVLVLGVYPMLQTLGMSIVQYDLMRIAREGTPFVGLENFRQIAAEPRFWIAFRNTLVFVAIVVGCVVALGLLIAQVLNMDFRGRGILRSLILVPWVTPPVVSSAIWIWMYMADRSPINQVLMSLGLLDAPIRFLTDATKVWGPFSVPMGAVSSVRVWNGLPFVTVMLLAGLQSIPHEVYEAAEIDGASSIARFRYITLPMLGPVLSVLVTLLTIGGIGHFEMNYIMTLGGPNDLTNVLSVLAYQSAFTFYRFDLGAAISAIILLTTGTVAAFYIRAQLRGAGAG
jgi:ABC-type sugar transport system permease subunit